MYQTEYRGIPIALDEQSGTWSLPGHINSEDCYNSLMDARNEVDAWLGVLRAESHLEASGFQRESDHSLHYDGSCRIKLYRYSAYSMWDGEWTVAITLDDGAMLTCTLPRAALDVKTAAQIQEECAAQEMDDFPF